MLILIQKFDVTSFFKPIDISVDRKTDHDEEDNDCIIGFRVQGYEHDEDGEDDGDDGDKDEEGGVNDEEEDVDNDEASGMRMTK